MTIIKSSQYKPLNIDEPTANCSVISHQLLIDNWKTILSKIENHRLQYPHNTQNYTDVNLIAVSKTKPLELILTLAKQGQEHFGENYLQEALVKIQNSKDFTMQTGCPITWHYIGHIQRNKTRDIAQNFHWVHTLDRVIIAERLNAQRPLDMSKLNVLLQINIDDEKSKSGCTPVELPALIDAITTLENLKLRGIMVIPKKDNDDSLVRSKQIFDKIQRDNPKLTSWDTLSMGMSSDLDEAIAQGSTMVRVGTAIFGTRS